MARRRASPAPDGVPAAPAGEGAAAGRRAATLAHLPGAAVVAGASCARGASPSAAPAASSVGIGSAADGPANTSHVRSPYSASCTAYNVRRTPSSSYHGSRSEQNHAEWG